MPETPEFTPPTSLAEFDVRVIAALDTIRTSKWENWANSAKGRYYEVRAVAVKDWVGSLDATSQWLQNLEATARMREGRTRGDQL